MRNNAVASVNLNKVDSDINSIVQDIKVFMQSENKVSTKINDETCALQKTDIDIDSLIRSATV
jgi:hypothetical protein